MARRTEGDIVRLGWPIGCMLGSELDLRERYDVSRSVLRQALRLVEHHQVARMRRGPNGGLFVSAPDAGAATRAVVLYLDYIGTASRDVLFTRHLLEPLAAARIDEDGIAMLREALREEQARSAEADLRSQDMLHTLLAELSGNPSLQLFIEVLIRFTTRYPHTPRRVSNAEVACAEADSRAAHARIVDAVIAGDDGNAHTEMARHLDEVTGWLDSYRATDRRGASTCPPPATPLTEGSHTKLAEVVAARIHEQIVTDGRRLGEVVGSEADLCSRYQISRAVLREAVRLLEHHAVARMRRGPGGGLIVTAPELAASIEAMALYLDYRSVNRDDLRAVREAIELGCIQRLIAGRHDPAMAARLLATVQAVIDDQADDRAAADQFHADLADLSGNAVLPVLLRILTELWCRHAAGPPSGATGTASEPHRVHRRILEAIVDGDEGLARHRMRRHLAALTAWWH